MQNQEQFSPIILNIETSTNVCSVALSEGANCVFKKSNADKINHATLLSVYIDEALQILKSQSKKLDAVAVSSGPGSYTGLRIGVSTAKGLCYGYNIPLVAVNTLEIMFSAASKLAENKENTLFCPMIDARRMEVYTAFFRADGTLYREVSADIISETSYSEILENNTVYFFGNGSDKCKPVLTHKNALFIGEIVPLAENMIELAVRNFSEKRFEDVAYFEPFYLKEFQATVPKKMF